MVPSFISTEASFLPTCMMYDSGYLLTGFLRQKRASLLQVFYLDSNLAPFWPTCLAHLLSMNLEGGGACFCCTAHLAAYGLFPGWHL